MAFAIRIGDCHSRWTNYYLIFCKAHKAIQRSQNMNTLTRLVIFHIVLSVNKTYEKTKTNQLFLCAIKLLCCPKND